jgi:TrpR-related protein YerC/YecD
MAIGSTKKAAVGDHPWVTNEMGDLFTMIAGLQTVDEVRQVLRDLCTMGELEAMAHRWTVAQLVNEEMPYLEIADRTGASTATVTRVAHWLRHGEGGYRLALQRRRPEKKAGSPSRSPRKDA